MIAYIQCLGNSVDAATELEDVSGATRNDLDTDQENRERRIASQLKSLEEKLKKELTSLLQVPEVKLDKLKTAVKLDLLTKLSESLQSMYSEIQAMVAETCKCNEDLKIEFYDFAYHGLRAEHNDLVLRVKDLESSQAEMSDDERKAFKRLQQYQDNRQRHIDRLPKVWKGLFSSVRKLFIFLWITFQSGGEGLGPIVFGVKIPIFVIQSKRLFEHSMHLQKL